MKRSARQIVSILMLALISTAQAEGDPGGAPSSAQMKRAANAEGISVVKSTPNLFHGTQNDPTPWECEPSLLYAAKYPLSQRETDFVLDYCSVLALAKRGRLGGNVIDVSNAVAAELPNTKKKFQRYQDADQFFLEVSGMRLTYAGAPKHYVLAWQVPQLPLIGIANHGLANAYAAQRANDPNHMPGMVSPIGLDQDYRKFGLEFFDRKYGPNASVSLSKLAPWPSMGRIALTASDDKSEYALETLTNNVPLREIDGTTFHQLELTGNLFYTVSVQNDSVQVTPQFLEAWLYKKIVRIPLSAETYTINCKTSGLFGKSYKCE